MTQVCSLPATNCFMRERRITSVPMSSLTLRSKKIGVDRWVNGWEGSEFDDMVQRNVRKCVMVRHKHYMSKSDIIFRQTDHMA